jgi:hypothetical protein
MECVDIKKINCTGGLSWECICISLNASKYGNAITLIFSLFDTYKTSGEFFSLMPQFTIRCESDAILEILLNR